ncbi:MAG: beta-ketoacyl-[acyl-carrier-protein] synthase family protein [Sulfurovaceae bacterium]|nr:beta-ketoacyl-[acyl-carrier-protein] synthase family protein [Sulfurovaceae bacterium]MDD5548516.1 beta-ketoacyl-[acyl-carrier-protein] synthase family protein [Sulfurovaceae bacterium]
MKHEVWLTSMSASCAAGLTIEDIYTKLLSGSTAISMQDKYIDNMIVPLGKIPSQIDFYELIYQNVATALSKISEFDCSDTLVLIGSSVGGMGRAERSYFTYHDCTHTSIEELAIGSIGKNLKNKFGFKDAISFSTACTSSSMAIDFAFDLIRFGKAKNVVVVGADELSRSAVNGFWRLGIGSTNITRPFDEYRDGINVGEGIGVIVLSNTPNEHKIAILGCGTTSDAYNITHPHPEGKGALGAMKQALQKASLEPNDIDYINAHGTGTVANDETEGMAIEKIFGNRPLVSSTKSVTGHTLGACGTLEIAICAMSIIHGTIPPSIGISNPISHDINLALKPIKSNPKFVLSNAFGFGGGNVSIILGKIDVD